jgi:hypothetical protein
MPGISACGEGKGASHGFLIKEPSSAHRGFNAARLLDEWPRWLVAAFLQNINPADGTS